MRLYYIAVNYRETWRGRCSVIVIPSLVLATVACVFCPSHASKHCTLMCVRGAATTSKETVAAQMH